MKLTITLEKGKYKIVDGIEGLDITQMLGLVAVLESLKHEYLHRIGEENTRIYNKN